MSHYSLLLFIIHHLFLNYNAFSPSFTAFLMILLYQAPFHPLSLFMFLFLTTFLYIIYLMHFTLLFLFYLLILFQIFFHALLSIPLSFFHQSSPLHATFIFLFPFFHSLHTCIPLYFPLLLLVAKILIRFGFFFMAHSIKGDREGEIFALVQNSKKLL